MSDRWAIQPQRSGLALYEIIATDGTRIAKGLSLVHAQLIAAAPELLDAVRDLVKVHDALLPMNAGQPQRDDTVAMLRRHGL